MRKGRELSRRTYTVPETFNRTFALTSESARAALPPPMTVAIPDFWQRFLMKAWPSRCDYYREQRRRDVAEIVFTMAWPRKPRTREEEYVSEDYRWSCLWWSWACMTSRSVSAEHASGPHASVNRPLLLAPSTAVYRRALRGCVGCGECKCRRGKHEPMGM